LKQDTISAEVNLDAGSTGGVSEAGNTALVQGGLDDDTLSFLIHNLGSGAQFAKVTGGAGTNDVCTRTQATVTTDGTCESDGLAP
jgi:hypothetical protein